MSELSSATDAGRVDPGRAGPVAWAIIAALAGAACGKSEPADRPAILLVVSVDWEGAYFSVEALAALDKLRRDNPALRMTHFLNAAYYTKPEVDRAEVTRLIRPAIRPGDESGLHVHAWGSLVTAAGVRVRDRPSFLRASGEPDVFPDDVGFDIDLRAYSTPELRAVFRKARELLVSEKFEIGPAFRAAAWLAGPGVLEAARAEGFTIDSSAIDGAWLDETPYLAAQVKQAWPKVEPTTQPYSIDTPAGRLVEIPVSGAMADYVTAAEMLGHLQWAAAEVGRAPARAIVVQLGVHAENADEFAPRLGEVLARLRADGVPQRFVTLSQAADAVRGQLEDDPVPVVK